MSKRYYTVVLFFLGITLFAGLTEGTMQFIVGDTLALYESYPPWYVVNMIAGFAVLFLLINYYWNQGWKWVAVAATLGLMANVLQSVIIFSMLEFQKLSAFYPPGTLIVSSITIVLGISLLFVKPGLLKWYGMIELVLGIALLWVTSWRLLKGHNLSPAINLIFAKSYTVLLLASMLVLVVHFWKERAKAVHEGEQMFTGIIIGNITLVFAVIFAALLIKEHFEKAYWDKKNFEKAQALAQRFESHTYISQYGDSLHYKLLRPLHYDTTRSYPLVVTLPYGGQPPTDPVKQIEGALGAEELTSDDNRQQYPAFIFIPHCSPGGGWGGVQFSVSIDTLVYQAIVDLDKRFAIDQKRRYVMGISRGGYGAWHFICQRPDLFAAAIPVAGAGNATLAPRAAGVSVWAFHGKHDIQVPVAGSQNMIAALKQAGAHPKYTEFANEGHNIGYQALQTPGLWNWLFAQQKQ